MPPPNLRPFALPSFSCDSSYATTMNQSSPTTTILRPRRSSASGAPTHHLTSQSHPTERLVYPNPVDSSYPILQSLAGETMPTLINTSFTRRFHQPDSNSRRIGLTGRTPFDHTFSTALYSEIEMPQRRRQTITEMEPKKASTKPFSKPTSCPRARIGGCR